ncbi:MAG: hypothetical protein WBV73_16165 [Phormidium sp.]
MSKISAVKGQGVWQKVLSSQKDFILLLSDIGRVYLTFSIPYDVGENRPFCLFRLFRIFHL